VYDKLARAQLVVHPFPHFYVENVFPGDFYQDLVRHLPPDEKYKPFEPPYEARHAIELDSTAAHSLGSRFWIDFEQWVNSQEFLERMAAKFEGYLNTMYRYRKNHLRKELSETGAVRITPRSLLSRDYGDFALLPHSDTWQKFIVGAFYFPRDPALRDFGTSIYRPKRKGFTDWNSTRHKREDFDLVRTFDNAPNSFFVFMKTDNSFHGVENKPYPNVGRDVLFWTPHVGRKAGAEGELRLPKRLFVPKHPLLSLLGLG
jgi:hypothetical protein